jgi:hypothetical protein
MKIEIFMVKTLNPSQKELDRQKEALIKLFGGLTIIPNCEGFWLEKPKKIWNKQEQLKTEKGTIWHDKVEIWQIYAVNDISNLAERLSDILGKIKRLTKQKEQVYAINDQLMAY